jgi:hypothetical protein
VPVTPTTTTLYDAADNVRVRIDELGKPTTATYDALNQRETLHSR